MSTEDQKAREAFEECKRLADTMARACAAVSRARFIHGAAPLAEAGINHRDAEAAFHAAIDRLAATPSLDVDALMALADAMIAAARRDGMFRQTKLLPEAREALRSALMSNAASEVDRSAVRREALEEAAKICRMNHRHTLSRAIRALADPLQGKETP